ncbi:hypothetical protein [Geminicoccus harenae]|nr:hypothetical protein [Geminicoccus harenae]
MILPSAAAWARRASRSRRCWCQRLQDLLQDLELQYLTSLYEIGQTG